MKIRLSQLRRIIREEVSQLNEYEQNIVRRGRDLYIVDDEGNEEYYGPASDMPDLGDGDELGSERSYRKRSHSGYGGTSRRRRRRW